MSSKSKDKIRLKFCGNQSESVAGSQTLINCGKSKKQILIDCGLVQENTSLLSEYKLNTKRFEFKPKNLSYIFITHAHLDHSGLVVRAVKEGFTGQIIVPLGTSVILKEMLLDSARIMERDSIYLSKKFNKSYPPIYTEDDVHKTMQFIREYKQEEKIVLDEDITFQFYPSQHIINSAQIVLWISNNGYGIKKIAFSGDLGNLSIDNDYVDKIKIIESANLFVGEATYCNKKPCSKKDREKDIEKIQSVVLTAIDNKGQVLIPTFALQRTQQMLTHLYNIFYEDSKNGKFNIPVYLGSPLATRISNLFLKVLKDKEQKEKWEKVLNWNNLHILKDFTELESALAKHKSEGKPAVWVASAGMMNAGYSVYIAKELLPSSKNTILFCGYAGEGTLAYKIKQKKQKTVTIEGKSIPSRCNIVSLNSMTSHIQKNDLLKLYSENRYDKIALVHCEMKDKVIFAKELQEAISKHNFSNKVICVNKNTEITL